MLAMPAPPRNSLRSLRELRSDSRGESDERCALRARADTAALLGCAQARRRRAACAVARAAARAVARAVARAAARAVARAVVDTVAACGSFIAVAATRNPVTAPASNTFGARRAAGGSGRARARAAAAPAPARPPRPAVG